MNISQYAKSLLYVALAAVTFIVTALSDNVLEATELINLGIITVGALGVYFVPNLPSGFAKYGKTAVAFGVAALAALLSFWGGGVSVSEWLQIGIAALAAIGVFIIPNEPAKVDAVAVYEGLTK